MGAVRSRLRRWHIWLGWIVAIPFLVWTVSGLVMVWKPIEEVRGTHMMRPAQSMRMPRVVVPPPLQGVPIASLSLEHRAPGARWVIALPDGTTRLADPLTGRLLPRLSASEAVAEVTGHYDIKAKLRSVDRTDPEKPPLEFRRNVGAWRVAYDDGTHFYVDVDSGKVVAARTGWWRFYDFMWGLHIMDPQTREDTHNPWVLGFGIVSLLTTLLALIMLPLTIRRRRKKAA